MLSKLFYRVAQPQKVTFLAARAFASASQAQRKPSIGDAVTILQSKVSNISQVVSKSSISALMVTCPVFKYLTSSFRMI